MATKEQFLADLCGSHSTARSKDVGASVNSLEDIKVLITLISMEQPYPIPEAAAWSIKHAVDRFKIHQPFLSKELTKKILVIDRDSLIKNILGTLKIIDWSEDIYGVMADRSLTFLSQPTRSKAVRYYSLENMTRICKVEPELYRELEMVVEELLPLSSEAFKRKWVKTKKTLRRI